MNLLQLVFKQMRQRALSTWLTLLSVMLGVALAVAIMILGRESDKLFGQSDFGYDLLVGAKGSKLGLVLNSVYQLGQSPGNIPYSMYEELTTTYRGSTRWAVPIAVGDQWNNYRIVATTRAMFGLDDEGNPLPPERSFEYRKDRAYDIAEGRVFHPRKFEAVVGWEVAQRGGLTVGSKFQPEHGLVESVGSFEDKHTEEWEVVGVLGRTGTASDKVILIPLISFYAIPEHEKYMSDAARLEAARAGGPLPPDPAPAPADAHADEDEHDSAHEEHAHDDDHESDQLLQDDHAHDDHDDHEHEAEELLTEAGAHNDEDDHGHDHAHDAYVLTEDGEIDLRLPKEHWKLSAVFVRSRGGHPAMSMMWAINNLPDAMAVNPAMEMRSFFDTFLRGGSQVLLVISALVTVVAAVSILVSIYNSISARKREIAILRALGATRVKILALICLEAGLIGVIGGLLGLVVGHLLGAGGSLYMQRLVGERINWLTVGAGEGLYLAVVIAIALLAGLVPALKAYRTPVATNLVSS